MQLQPGFAGALSQLTSLISAEGATVQATTIAGLYEVQGPTANMAQLAARARGQPGRPVCRPRTDRLGPDGAQRPGLHQRQRVAVERHLGHQCPRGLERHHRLGPSDCRRHRHGYRLQPSRPL